MNIKIWIKQRFLYMKKIKEMKNSKDRTLFKRLNITQKV